MPTQIKIDLADVRRKFGLVAAQMRRPLLVAVAEWLRFIIRQSFDQQSTPEGIPWKTLSQPYGKFKQMATGKRARRVGPGGQPGGQVLIGGKKKLYRSGDLFHSLDRGILLGEDRVWASSMLPYAAAQNFGATISIPEIRPKKANGVLRWFGPDGPVFALYARAHRVTLPARAYLPTPAFAETQAAMVIDETLQDAINRAGAGQ
ncbi:MAG: hypothetical protein LAN84_15525 [Acidobacteriia bacterium]|nr:hypothetical protein [Terriglobia bacterium]